jgi:hypothetical protein
MVRAHPHQRNPSSPQPPRPSSSAALDGRWSKVKFSRHDRLGQKSDLGDSCINLAQGKLITNENESSHVRSNKLRSSRESWRAYIVCCHKALIDCHQCKYVRSTCLHLSRPLPAWMSRVSCLRVSPSTLIVFILILLFFACLRFLSLSSLVSMNTKLKVCPMHLVTVE